jgi:glycosyltransferase involved in cell wall biosynthesis
MKIIYVENVRIPSERAHAYQIVQTCTWFARMGHEVVLVNPDRAGGKDVFAAYNLLHGIFRHQTLKTTDPLSWEWFRLKKLAYIWQRFSFSRALKSWAKNQTADVWYTRDPAMVDVLGTENRKFVLELHDRPDSNFARWERIKSLVKNYVVISEGLKQALQSLGIEPSRIYVAPDGYDPKDFENPGERVFERKKLGIPEGAFVAIYTGGFYKWKGIDLTLRAWARTDDDAHLVLVGGPECDRKRLEGLVEPAVASRIHIFPMMDHAAAIRVLAAADVGLLTSSKEHEIGRVFTSPLKQFEYLAAGLPVLASDVSSSHEILTDEVAAFYEPTEEGFAAALNGIKSNQSWRASASAKSRELVAPYTWEARARTIVSAL